MTTAIDAAAFVRSRLHELHHERVTQEEMASLIEDLKAVMGRPLKPSDVAEVVEAFTELAEHPLPPPQEEPPMLLLPSLV